MKRSVKKEHPLVRWCLTGAVVLVLQAGTAWAADPPARAPLPAVEENPAGTGRHSFVDPTAARPPAPEPPLSAQYDGDYWKMVRIIDIAMERDEAYRAMIRNPDGKTAVARNGSLLGPRGGEVIEVSLRGIRVVEKFPGVDGEGAEREIYIPAFSE